METIKQPEQVDFVGVTTELDEACQLIARVRNLVGAMYHGDEHIVELATLCESADALLEKAGRLIEAQCPRLGYASEGWVSGYRQGWGVHWS